MSRRASDQENPKPNRKEDFDLGSELKMQRKLDAGHRGRERRKMRWEHYGGGIDCCRIKNRIHQAENSSDLIL